MNRSIIIGNIDSIIFERLSLEAKKQGTDLKTIVVSLLRNSLGLNKSKSESISHNDLEHLAGTWTENDYLDFIKHTSSFNKVEDELWD